MRDQDDCELAGRIMTLAFTIATVILTSVLYFTGWMYLFYFLRAFGFSIFEVAIPFHYIIVYSFAVLDGYVAASISTGIALLGFLIVFLLLSAFCDSQMVEPSSTKLTWFAKPRYLFPVVGSLLLAVVLSSFWQAHDAARTAAQDEAREIREKPRPHLLQIREEARTSVESYGVRTGNVNIARFLLQDPGSYDWQDYIVDVVLADRDTYFVVLSRRGNDVEVPVRIQRDDVVFIGAPERANGGQ